VGLPVSRAASASLKEERVRGRPEERPSFKLRPRLVRSAVLATHCPETEEVE